MCLGVAPSSHPYTDIIFGFVKVELIRWDLQLPPHLSLSRSVLGDGLGSLGDGVLGELSREHKSDCGLNLSRRKSLLLVVSDELDSFLCDTVEDIVDERVHNSH